MVFGCFFREEVVLDVVVCFEFVVVCLFRSCFSFVFGKFKRWGFDFTTMATWPPEVNSQCFFVLYFFFCWPPFCHRQPSLAAQRIGSLNSHMP